MQKQIAFSCIAVHGYDRNRDSQPFWFAELKRNLSDNRLINADVENLAIADIMGTAVLLGQRPSERPLRGGDSCKGNR